MEGRRQRQFCVECRHSTSFRRPMGILALLMRNQGSTICLFLSNPRFGSVIFSLSLSLYPSLPPPPFSSSSNLLCLDDSQARMKRLSRSSRPICELMARFLLGAPIMCLACVTMPARLCTPPMASLSATAILFPTLYVHTLLVCVCVCVLCVWGCLCRECVVNERRTLGSGFQRPLDSYCLLPQLTEVLSGARNRLAAALLQSSLLLSNVH